MYIFILPHQLDGSVWLCVCVLKCFIYFYITRSLLGVTIDLPLELLYEPHGATEDRSCGGGRSPRQSAAPARFPETLRTC